MTCIPCQFRKGNRNQFSHKFLPPLIIRHFASPLRSSLSCHYIYEHSSVSFFAYSKPRQRKPGCVFCQHVLLFPSASLFFVPPVIHNTKKGERIGNAGVQRPFTTGQGKEIKFYFHMLIRREDLRLVGLIEKGRGGHWKQTFIPLAWVFIAQSYLSTFLLPRGSHARRLKSTCRPRASYSQTFHARLKALAVLIKSLIRSWRSTLPDFFPGHRKENDMHRTNANCIQCIVWIYRAILSIYVIESTWALCLSSLL